MRCKNCGSSAQFKLVYVSETERTLHHKYKCGCGATAEITYEKVKSNFFSPTGTKL